MKKIVMAVMVIVMMAVIVNPVNADAATKVKLNKTKATLTITDKKKNPTVTLKVKGTSKKAKWTTSDKKVATVKNGKVTAKGAGKATITCKVNGKTLKCKVTVKDKRAGLEVSVKTVPVSLDDVTKNHYGLTYHTSRIVVTYNGKDVTNKVECWLYDVGNDEDATIFNGNEQIPAYENGTFKFTVNYKGMEKTLKLKTKVTKCSYYECNCGMIFDNGLDCVAHNEASALEAVRTGIKNKCGGYAVYPYFVSEATIVK